MTKKVKLLNSERMLTNSGAEADPFLNTFGVFIGISETGDLLYAKNRSKKFRISEQKIKNPHQIKVPLINPGSITFLESVYRESNYVVEDLLEDGTELDNYVDYGTRRTYFNTEFNTTFYRDELEAMISIDDSEITGDETSVDFYYHKKNKHYDSMITEQLLQTDETRLMNFYNDLAIPFTLGTYKFERPETYLKNSLASKVPGDEKMIIMAPEFCDHPIYGLERSNSLLNPSLKTNWFDSHEPVIKDEINAFQEIPYYVRVKINRGHAKTKGNLVVNNLMFFDSSHDKSVSDYDLGPLLMRWHATQKQKINKNFNFTISGLSENMTDIYAFSNEIGNQVTGNMYSYDLIEWLIRFSPSIVGSFSSGLKSIGPKTNSIKLAEVKQSNLLLVLASHIKFGDAFAGTRSIEEKGLEKLFKEVYSLMPDFRTIASTGMAMPSEVMFYKIEKFDENSNNKQPIQTIMIPNLETRETNELGNETGDYKRNPVIEYIDTQVIYGKVYRYQISEVRAVFGFEYEFIKPGPTSKKRNNKNLLKVRQFPRIRIVEVPIYEQTGKILACPPMSPSVEMMPIRRVPNRFRLFLQNSYGTKRETPIDISSTSEEYNRFLVSNSLRFKNSLKTVKFDDASDITDFEIYFSPTEPTQRYRIETKKLNVDYSDFMGNLYATIPVREGDAAAVDINLEPNKKYYMCFVSVSEYSLRSNPTEIYELEMVNQGGLSYLKTKIYEPQDKAIFFKKTKKIHKMLEIGAASGHTEIKFDEDVKLSDNEDGEPVYQVNSIGIPVKLGDVDDSLFPKSGISNVPSVGKKFKFRLISTKTNQKIDLNVTCQHERIRSMFERIPRREGDSSHDNSNMVQPEPKLDQTPMHKNTDNFEIKPIPVIFTYE